jgi:anti-sigma B factor antagonist
MRPMVQTVKLSGSLDISCFDRFFGEIIAALKLKPDLLIVDMQDVSFIDNSGLEALITALTIIRANGGRLALSSLSESVEVVIELTGSQRFFDILPGAQQKAIPKEMHSAAQDLVRR